MKRLMLIYENLMFHLNKEHHTVFIHTWNEGIKTTIITKHTLYLGYVASSEDIKIVHHIPSTNYELDYALSFIN